MQFLLNHCHIALQENGGILFTLFIAGIFGGFTHCAGMCGPFVLAQVNCNGNKEKILNKLSGAALLPYHFGRMTTYMILGAIAAILSRQIIGTPLQQGLSFLFLSIAGIIFIISAAPQARKFVGGLNILSLSKLGIILGNIVKILFNRPIKFKGYLLGILLGFLPCGLIFASLMIVATTGSIFTASLGMLLFTLGTFPSMFIIGLGGHLIYNRWPNGIKNVARYIMIFNGLNLFALAGSTAFNL